MTTICRNKFINKLPTAYRHTHVSHLQPQIQMLISITAPLSLKCAAFHFQWKRPVKCSLFCEHNNIMNRCISLFKCTIHCETSSCPLFLFVPQSLCLLIQLFAVRFANTAHFNKFIVHAIKAQILHCWLTM